MTYEKFTERFKTVLVTLALVSAVYLIGRVRGCIYPPHDFPQLHPSNKEQISYDESSHTLITVTPQGVKRQFAKNPEITISKTNVVTTVTHPVGKEFEPFLGIGWGDGPRVHLGLSLYHFWRVDINGQLAFSLNTTIAPVIVIPVASLSYNVWRNTNLFVGIDPVNVVLGKRSAIHGGIYVAF